MEQQLLKKLKIIDDETLTEVDNKRIEKINDEYRQLELDVKEMKEIMKDTNNILKQQGEQIHDMSDRMIEVVCNTNQSRKDLDSISNNLNRKSVMKPIIVGLLGVSVLGPLGAFAGLSGGAMTTVCSMAAIAGVMYA